MRGYKQPFNRFDKIVRIKKKKKTAIFQIVFWFSRTEGAKLESRGPEVRPPPTSCAYDVRKLFFYVKYCADRQHRGLISGRKSFF